VGSEEINKESPSAWFMFTLNAYSSDDDNLPLDQEDAQYFEDELTVTQNSDEDEDNSSKDPTSSIEDIFRCPICLGRVRSAQMCPSCSKICCGPCIKRWLAESKQCPHCRAPLTISQLVNCRFVAEISAELDKLKTSSKNKQKQLQDDICGIHNAPLYYYCVTDTESICSDCAMFDKKHQGHQFEHLRTVYERHCELVKNEASIVKKRLKELSSLMQALETNIESVTKAKEERTVELRHALEQMQGRLDSQLKAKLLTLLAQKNTMVDEIELLDSMLHEVNRQLTTAAKSAFIAKCNQLVSMLREAYSKPTNKYGKLHVSAEFDSEIIPQYDSCAFRIKNYSTLRHTTEVIYSDPLFVNGLTWRLKVYPNGNGVAKGSYLSVFLEMLKGLREASKYEYRVEMINHRNHSQMVVREFASDFEEGECWGYNRFFQIDSLEREGYLGEDDSLSLRFYVRAPTFYQLCRDQQLYIEQLEASRAESALREAELKHHCDLLQKKLSKGPTTRKLASSEPATSKAYHESTQPESNDSPPVSVEPSPAKSDSPLSPEPHQQAPILYRSNSVSSPNNGSDVKLVTRQASMPNRLNTPEGPFAQIQIQLPLRSFSQPSNNNNNNAGESNDGMPYATNKPLPVPQKPSPVVHPTNTPPSQIKADGTTPDRKYLTTSIDWVDTVNRLSSNTRKNNTVDDSEFNDSVDEPSALFSPTLPKQLQHREEPDEAWEQLELLESDEEVENLAAPSEGPSSDTLPTEYHKDDPVEEVEEVEEDVSELSSDDKRMESITSWRFASQDDDEIINQPPPRPLESEVEYPPENEDEGYHHNPDMEISQDFDAPE